MKNKLKLILWIEGMKNQMIITEEEKIIKKLRKKILNPQTKFLEVRFENENIMINKDIIRFWKIKKDEPTEFNY